MAAQSERYRHHLVRANLNTQGNQGVGGLVLPEAGYTELTSEYDLRLAIADLGANLLHETRIGYSWNERPRRRTQRSCLAGSPDT